MIGILCVEEDNKFDIKLRIILVKYSICQFRKIYVQS